LVDLSESVSRQSGCRRLPPVCVNSKVLSRKSLGRSRKIALGARPWRKNNGADRIQRGVVRTPQLPLCPTKTTMTTKICANSRAILVGPPQSALRSFANIRSGSYRSSLDRPRRHGGHGESIFIAIRSKIAKILTCTQRTLMEPRATLGARGVLLHRESLKDCKDCVLRTAFVDLSLRESFFVSWSGTTTSSATQWPSRTKSSNRIYSDYKWMTPLCVRRFIPRHAVSDFDRTGTREPWQLRSK
jgi:hypothetical protein